MTHLLDASVLIPLTDQQHTAHQSCREWFGREARKGYATCAITELALLRYALRFYPSLGMSGARELLGSIRAHPSCRYIARSPEPLALSWAGVIGHAQVTDAYLVGLARAEDMTLATLDQGLAAVHPDVAVMISSPERLK